MSNPKYDLGHFHQNYKELICEDGQEQMLQKHFIGNEDKVRNAFKSRIANLAKYYQELNQEFNFSGLPKNVLFHKLRVNKAKNNEEKLKKRHYFLKGDFFGGMVSLLKFRIDNIKFFTLGDEAFEEQNSKAPKSIVSKMSLFSLNESELFLFYLFRKKNEFYIKKLICNKKINS